MSAERHQTRCKIAKLIWSFSERYGIPLGRFAPVVFGWMISCDNYSETMNDE